MLSTPGDEELWELVSASTIDSLLYVFTYLNHSGNDRSNIVLTLGFEPRTAYTLGSCLTYCAIRHLTYHCKVDKICKFHSSIEMFISLHTIYNIIFSDRMDHFLLSVSKGYYTTIPKTKMTIFKPNLPAQPSDENLIKVNNI